MDGNFGRAKRARGRPDDVVRAGLDDRPSRRFPRDVAFNGRLVAALNAAWTDRLRGTVTPFFPKIGINKRRFSPPPSTPATSGFAGFRGCSGAALSRYYRYVSSRLPRGRDSYPKCGSNVITFSPKIKAVARPKWGSLPAKGAMCMYVYIQGDSRR